MKELKDVTTAIKMQAVKRGYNTMNVAKIMRVSVQTLYRNYRQPGNFTLAELNRFCKKVGIKLEDLLGTIN